MFDCVIFGCGDVGRRIVQVLNRNGLNADKIVGYINTQKSKSLAASLGVHAEILDLDSLEGGLAHCHDAKIYYTVAPQKTGEDDLRSHAVLRQFEQADIRPKKVVLISTTGVYGDCNGEWVDETSPTLPQTLRGKRRLDSEQQWLAWGKQNAIDVVVLRVPGIYAFSRIPRARIEKRIPVVRAVECGFTNRIHADDLARVCVIAMDRAKPQEIYNITDGTPGKITEYLIEAAKVLDMPPLPEISLEQAQSELSAGMLSYLGESRKISNKKMLRGLAVSLLYPDFKRGLRH